METEEIKKIVYDERTAQLTTQLCNHWNVATERLEVLAQEVADGTDTCIEAEIYAAIMRMQRAVAALVELNKMPCAYLYSECLTRIGQTVTNPRIRQSVILLINKMITEDPIPQQPSFFELVEQLMKQHMPQPDEKLKAILQKVSPIEYLFSICAKHMNPNDLMMLAPILQNMKTDSDDEEQEEAENYLKDLRQTMDALENKMYEGVQAMMLWLLMLMLLPGLLVDLMQQFRNNSQSMANLFNKELARVRKSNDWFNYWAEHRETLRVVSDSSSWKDIMAAERGKERTELGKVPGGLFAKWATDREAFKAHFLDAQLSDDALQHFIFHLAVLSEIARELDPTSKFGNEQLVKNDQQQVGEAVLAAAGKLQNLADDRWMPYYEKMWQELISDEDIFAHLKVTRKSPHNNLFTARFFCHLVGEMKKSAVFGASSDRDLAIKLTDKRYVDTFRKNIQEGMSEDAENLQKKFSSIYHKYNNLVHSRK